MAAPIAAHTTVMAYTSAMRHLIQTGPLSVKELASRDNRVASNIRRDAPKLVDAGYISLSGDTLSLTDQGRRWVAGQDIAEGLTTPPPSTVSPSATPQRWPAAAIRPNPLNRKVTMEGIPALAEAIIAAGDILQPLLLTPPDAYGVRTILAGERRWTAVNRLISNDAEARDAGGPSTPDLPAALEEGLPFIEREADEAQALLITLLENSNREDLTPWQDAQQLLKLADATGWSGAELARRVGRAGSERDIQIKLKVAREATPEAIADYEANGSWDRLRDSVRRANGPDNINLALFLVEAALKSDAENGVWDGDLRLDSGLHWPADWGKWFTYDIDTGVLSLTLKASAWLASEGLGDEDGETLRRHRAACGLIHRPNLEPFVTPCLNWSPTPDHEPEPDPALPLASHATSTNSAPDPAPEVAPGDAEYAVLTSYAWAELLHKIQHQPFGPPTPIVPTATTVGCFWKHADAIAMQQAGLVTFCPQPGTAPLATLTDKGRSCRWNLARLRRAHTEDLMTDQDLTRHPDSPGDFTGTYATPWLATIPVAALYPEADPTPAPSQTDLEEACAPQGALTLSEIRLTPVCHGEVWELNNGLICMATLTGAYLTPQDATTLAHRLAEAFNAAQDAAHA